MTLQTVILQNIRLLIMTDLPFSKRDKRTKERKILRKPEAKRRYEHKPFTLDEIPDENVEALIRFSQNETTFLPSAGHIEDQFNISNSMEIIRIREQYKTKQKKTNEAQKLPIICQTIRERHGIIPSSSTQTLNGNSNQWML